MREQPERTRQWCKRWEVCASLATVNDLADGACLFQKLDEAVTTLKQVTRRYARRQRTFVENRLVKRGVRVMELDSTRVDLWEAKVRNAPSRVRCVWHTAMPMCVDSHTCGGSNVAGARPRRSRGGGHARWRGAAHCTGRQRRRGSVCLAEAPLQRV